MASCTSARKRFRRKIPTMKANSNPKVVVTWRPVTGKPSAAWRRLWSKLLANRRQKPAGTGQDAGEKGSGNDGATP